MANSGWAEAGSRGLRAWAGAERERGGHYDEPNWVVGLPFSSGLVTS